MEKENWSSTLILFPMNGFYFWRLFRNITNFDDNFLKSCVIYLVEFNFNLNLIFNTIPKEISIRDIIINTKKKRFVQYSINNYIKIILY